MAVVVRFLRYGRNDDGEFNPPSRPRGTRLTGKEGGPLAPGVVMLRADIRPWSRAAIYPPSVPPEGGKQDRLRAVGVMLRVGRAEAASLCNRDPAGHNQGMCRAWALVAVRDGLERTAWFVMAGGRSQHQKC